MHFGQILIQVFSLPRTFGTFPGWEEMFRAYWAD